MWGFCLSRNPTKPRVVLCPPGDSNSQNLRSERSTSANCVRRARDCFASIPATESCCSRYSLEPESNHAPHAGFYPQNSAGRSHGDSNPDLEPDKLLCHTFTLWDHVGAPATRGRVFHRLVWGSRCNLAHRAKTGLLLKRLHRHQTEESNPLVVALETTLGPAKLASLM